MALLLLDYHVQLLAGEVPMATGRGTILIVEDDPDVATAVRLILEANGHRVLCAANAPEGQRLAEESRPDLILLDVMMPTGTEGFHFAWGLRNHPDPKLRETPIIVISAIHRTTELRFYPESSDQEYGPGEFLPVQGFLDKPVDPDELIRRVEDLLARPSVGGGVDTATNMERLEPGEPR